MSKVECEFVLEYDNEKKAKIIRDSLEPDNENYVQLKQDGKKLKAKCIAKTPMELLSTIDDFLSCLTISEDSVEKL